MKIHSVGISSMVAVLSAVACAFFATPAQADDAGAAPAGECSGGTCGTPANNGGGCGCGCGGSILVDYTDIGKTYQQSDDSDGDGIDDALDNCVYVPNANQVDVDGDGVGDVCDNCSGIANKDQKANGCGNVWAATTAGFNVGKTVNNVGQVIGAVCDNTCTLAAENATPVTVSLAGGPSEPATTGSATGSPPASGDAACSVTNVGAQGAPAGLFVSALGVLAVGLVRRRRVSAK